MSKFGRSGQIGLVVLLLMGTMLVVGVGAVSRSTRDLKITRQELEASQVFNAAEAGIEAGLNDLDNGVVGGGSVSDIDNTDVSYSVEEVREFDMEVADNTSITIDVGGATGSPLLIDWGLGRDACTTPSLVVVAYNTSGSPVSARRFGFSGCDVGNNFQVFPGSGGYAGGVSFGLLPGDELVRIRPVGGDVDVRVTSGDGAFPVQFHRVSSVASRIEGDSVKAIEVQKSLPAAPSVFDYTLFSGTTLVK